MNMILASLLALLSASHAAPVPAAGQGYRPGDILVVMGDPAIFNPMSDELKRTVERLEMEKLGLPYFVAYAVRDTRRIEVEGSFGAVKNFDDARSRRVSIDLRVGSAQFDNTHYVGRDDWNFAPVTESLVFENEYDALRYDLWSATDRAYKAAMETLSRKKAYKQSRLIKDEIPDLSVDPPDTTITGLTEFAFDRKAWEDSIRRLSAVFKSYPAIQRSEVNLFWSEQRFYALDSQGRQVQKNTHDVEVYFDAYAQAPDGMKLHDRRRIIRQNPADLPPYAELEKEAAALARGLSDLAAAPLWEEPYTGPVLLEGQAAGEFFDQLLARNLSSPRSLWIEEEDRMKEYFPSGAFADRLGLRVVAPMLSVFDDPAQRAFEGVPLAGHYRTDDEGIRARRVDLIQRGILKDLLMSRSPTKERKVSNGHGRASMGEFVTARIGNLFVEADPARTADAAGMKAELLRQAKAYGLSYGVLIRRMHDESRRESSEQIAPPLAVYKVRVKDGREELFRNAKFTSVTLRALRDISLASKARRVYNYYQLGPYRFSRGEVGASIIHPDVLVSELELKKTEEKPEKLPVLPHPFFAGKKP